MIISVASGKGGTGKTTIAVNLALSLEGRIQFLDLDVEEPDAHLFIRPEMESTRPVGLAVPEIDAASCTVCGKCVKLCRFNALTTIADKILVFPELCHSCGGCTLICPEGAVRETERTIGVVETGWRGGLQFVHGRLKIGESLVPPLIKRVKKEISESATVIIDSPPGTSCPVISAISGTDFVLLVTEPTPFGLHDLTLAVDAVRQLEIPHGLVINRSDIGDEGVREFAAAKNIPVLMEIPFSRSLAEAYSRGVSLVELMPGWKKRFSSLFAHIRELVNYGEKKR